MRADSILSIRWATEVSTVARTRNENDVVPMDVSVLSVLGGKGKDGQGKDGKNKEGKEKTKAKDDKDKSDPKSRSNKDKKCFSTVTGSATSELTVERRNGTMKNARQCLRRTVKPLQTHQRSHQDSRTVRRTFLKSTRRLSDSSLLVLTSWMTNFTVRRRSLP